jgi:hypothetical protein
MSSTGLSLLGASSLARGKDDENWILTGSFLAYSLTNIFVIGQGNKPWISLPKGKGVKLTISEERDQRRRAKAQE